MLFRVSAPGTEAERWERDTWFELEKLARLHPESGIHFQGSSCMFRACEV